MVTGCHLRSVIRTADESISFQLERSHIVFVSSQECNVLRLWYASATETAKERMATYQALKPIPLAKVQPPIDCLPGQDQLVHLTRPRSWGDDLPVTGVDVSHRVCPSDVLIVLVYPLTKLAPETRCRYQFPVSSRDVDDQHHNAH